MTGLAFRFAGADLVARASGALWWPRHRALIVADLHLGKSERLARRRGTLLPPFETRDTLHRLEAEIAATDPAQVISLGDAFDDDAARGGLPPEDRAALDEMLRTAPWHWVAGNHDSGSGSAALWFDDVALRHVAGDGPDISGHYHPKARISGQRRAVFVCGAQHLILPAFGTYTGGLDVTAPALRPYATGARLIATGRRAVMFPGLPA